MPLGGRGTGPIQNQTQACLPRLRAWVEVSHGRAITWSLRAKEAPNHIKVEWPGSS